MVKSEREIFCFELKMILNKQEYWIPHILDEVKENIDNIGFQTSFIYNQLTIDGNNGITLKDSYLAEMEEA